MVADASRSPALPPWGFPEGDPSQGDQGHPSVAPQGRKGVQNEGVQCASPLQEGAPWCERGNDLREAEPFLGGCGLWAELVQREVEPFLGGCGLWVELAMREVEPFLGGCGLWVELAMREVEPFLGGCGLWAELVQRKVEPFLAELVLKGVLILEDPSGVVLIGGCGLWVELAQKVVLMCCSRHVATLESVLQEVGTPSEVVLVSMVAVLKMAGAVLNLVLKEQVAVRSRTQKWEGLPRPLRVEGVGNCPGGQQNSVLEGDHSLVVVDPLPLLGAEENSLQGAQGP